jgi:GH24 family phage-related lysozyme (muramidase)
MGSRGEVAKMRCKTDRKLRQVRITYEEGREIFPHVAKDYWEGITRRFPALVSPLVPGAVHTALLSLAFNRGVWNGDLEQLRDKIQNREWGEMADAISSMQQNHSLKGIRVRRRLEGQKIRRAARLLALAEEIGELTPAGPVAL